MHRKSEMRLAPKDQPGDQKNQGEKNRRAHSQRPYEPACVNLRKTTYCIDMRSVSSTQTTERQDSGDDTAKNEDIGNTRHCGNNIKEQVLLFGQQGTASLRGGVGDDGVSGEKERLGSHQPRESLHDEIIFVLDLVPDGSIPIGGTKQIGCGDTHAPRFAPSGKLGRRKCVRCGLKSRTTLVQVPWRDLPEYAIVPFPAPSCASAQARNSGAVIADPRCECMPIAKSHTAKDGRGSKLCALPRPRRWDLSSSSGSRTGPRP
jgi:hypothetical protein